MLILPDIKGYIISSKIEFMIYDESMIYSVSLVLGIKHELV